MTLQPESAPGVTPLGKKGTGSYLNPQQFMPMRRVMQMHPLDGASDMQDLVDMKRSEVANGEGDTADYPALIDQMRKDGPTGTEVPPIFRNRDYDPSHPVGTLGNGGHRVSIAHDLGWKSMRYTSDKEDSGYGDDRFPSNYGDDDWDEGNSSTPEGYRRTTYGGVSAISGYGGGESTPEGTPHDPRNHVPKNTGMSGTSNLGRQRGRLWHDPGMPGAPRLGDNGPGPGLHTQLHPPAEQPLQAQQFGGTKLGQNSDYKPGRADYNKQQNYQQKLPGMPVHFQGGGPTDWKQYNEAAYPSGRAKLGFNTDEGKQDSLGAALRPVGWEPGDGAETMRGKFQAQAKSSAAPHGRWPGGGKILTGDL